MTLPTQSFLPFQRRAILAHTLRHRTLLLEKERVVGEVPLEGGGNFIRTSRHLSGDVYLLNEKFPDSLWFLGAKSSHAANQKPFSAVLSTILSVWQGIRGISLEHFMQLAQPVSAVLSSMRNEKRDTLPFYFRMMRCNGFISFVGVYVCHIVLWPCCPL